MLSGTFIMFKSGRDSLCPSSSTAIPTTAASKTAPAEMNGSSCFLPLPIHLAAAMLAPTESPDDTVTIMAIISAFVPTAARAFDELKKPTTHVSAELKSC